MPTLIWFAVVMLLVGLAIYFVKFETPITTQFRIPLVKTLEILLGILFGVIIAVVFFPGLFTLLVSNVDIKSAKLQSAPLKACLIGMGAAAAYYYAVSASLIATSLRDSLVAALQNSFTARLLYFAFGGLVAGTVQLADREHFAPIQALVLGASWPAFIASQIGKDSSGGSKTLVENKAKATPSINPITPPTST